MREMLDAAEGVYTQRKQLIVWNKSNGGMGAFYRSKHELIFVLKSGKAKHINNFGLGDTRRYRTNIWDYQGANVPHAGRDRDLASHPTCKPVLLVADAMLDCSNPGDIVVDPFLGSGTSLHSAHLVGRRGYGIEIDLIYADTIIRRMADATGLEAIHEDGRTFAEVTADRQNEGEADQ